LNQNIKSKNQEKKNLIYLIKNNNKYLKMIFKNTENFYIKKEKNFMILMILEMKLMHKQIN